MTGPGSGLGASLAFYTNASDLTAKANCSYVFQNGDRTKLHSVGCLVLNAGDSVTAARIVLTSGLDSASTVSATISVSGANPCNDNNACTTDSCAAAAGSTNTVLQCSSKNTSCAPQLGVATLDGGATTQYLVDQSEIPLRPLRIHGVDRAGAHWACVAGPQQNNSDDSHRLFHGGEDQASINHMLDLKVNAVRIPLNEDCWLLGASSDPSYLDYAGPDNHQKYIKQYVDLLTNSANRMVVILDLHWSGQPPATGVASGQATMANRKRSLAFWSSVATMFRGNRAVIFDLFNEPVMGGDTPAASDWDCWLNGTTPALANDAGLVSKTDAGVPKNNCRDADKNALPYAVAGMAELYKTVRTAAPDNVVLMGGLNYAHEFGTQPSSTTGWVSSVQKIPGLTGMNLTNVAASYHQYDLDVYTGCPCTSGDAGAQLTKITSVVNTQHVTEVLDNRFAMVVGETGLKKSKTGGFSLPLWQEEFLHWADSRQVGFLAWNWNDLAFPQLFRSNTAPFTTPADDLSDAGVVYFDHFKDSP